MSVDRLQDRIRKTKNPSMVELCLAADQLPPHLLTEEGSPAKAYLRFCRELLTAVKGSIPAVRVSFASFALLGAEGILALQLILQEARAAEFYVILDSPEIYDPSVAAMIADGLFGENSLYPCDGLVISGYAGSDVIKPFLRYCKEGKKDLFVVTRTANKSAPELQDLLAGSRLVHMAAADHVNRYGTDTAGKFGYTRVGVMVAAGAQESLRSIRAKYPKLFLLLDGYDYSNANGKSCSYAFDRFGYGAVVCAGHSITCAWRQAESDGSDYLDHALTAAERMKKNILRYTNIL